MCVTFVNIRFPQPQARDARSLTLKQTRGDRLQVHAAGLLIGRGGKRIKMLQETWKVFYSGNRREVWGQPGGRQGAGYSGIVALVVCKDIRKQRL